MSNLLEVRLDSVAVARIEVSRGVPVLRYEREYATTENAVPLSLSLPLDSLEHRGHSVERFLDNLLPDNSQVRDAWAREAGLDSTSPLDLLSAYGQDAAGAFTFHGETAAYDDASVEVESSEIAELVRKMRTDATSWPVTGKSGRFSLAGAQAKTSLRYNGLRWFMTSGATPSTHILKPEIPGFPDSDLIEHIVMSSARRVGIAAADTWVGNFEGERALVVVRFDRTTSIGGRLIRLHQEDLLQAMGQSRLKKYQSDGGPTPEQILRVLDATHDEWAAVASKTQYLQQLAYHWIVGGTDAHAKNYAIFLAARQHILTPMYDASSFIPYIDAKQHDVEPEIARLELSANIGTGYRIADATEFEWRALARKARVADFDIVTWIRNTTEQLAIEIDQACRSVLQTYDSTVVERFQHRFALRTAQVAEALGG